MGLITLREYSERNNKNQGNMRTRACSGKFKTAVKIGRDWFIDEDEPFVDSRVKSGNYVDWRKYGRRGRPKDPELS